MNFNLPLATRLAYLAGAAYLQNPSVASRTTDTEVVITDETEGESVIAFRGTSDLRDALTDAQIALHGIPGGRVHAGIHDAVESVLVDLVRAMRLRGPQQKFWFTGHSLGGAEAVLAAYCLSHQSDGFNIGGVITFGAPRFCDAAFAQTYNALLADRTFRVVKQFDPIPHLPFPGVLLPYRHVGHEIYVPESGPAVQDRSMGRVLLMDAWATLKAVNEIRNGNLWLGDDIAVEHGIEDYRQALSLL